jgi:putative membrane protein (TIGR04086 family)
MNKTTKRPKRRRTPSESAGGIKELLKGTGIGLLFSLGSAIILSLISSIICIGRNDPASLTPYFSLVSLGVSAFIGGAVSSKLCKSFRIIPPLLTASLEKLVFYMLSFIIPTNTVTSNNFIVSLVIRAVILLLSALGGSLGMRRISHKTRRKRR